MKNKKNKGFSMIELIIVIAIMAILIAVLAPVYTRYLERARRSDDQQIAKTLKEAVEIALADPQLDNPDAGTYLIAGTNAGLTAVDSNDFWDDVAATMDADYTSATLMRDGLPDEMSGTGFTSIELTISANETVSVTITYDASHDDITVE